jgi:hypothetical protein
VIPWTDDIQFYLDFDRFSWPGVTEFDVLEFAAPSDDENALPSLMMAGFLFAEGVSVWLVFGALVWKHVERKRIVRGNAS